MDLYFQVTDPKTFAYEVKSPIEVLENLISLQLKENISVFMDLLLMRCTTRVDKVKYERYRRIKKA